jgi:hypothetical protein
MSFEQPNNIAKKLPSIYRKGSILGVFGASIGAGAGAIIGLYFGNNTFYIFAGIGAASGALIGHIIGMLVNNTISLENLQQIQRAYFIFLGILFFLLSILGIIGFVMTGKWIGIISAIFFLICGAYAYMITRSP